MSLVASQPRWRSLTGRSRSTMSWLKQVGKMTAFEFDGIMLWLFCFVHDDAYQPVSADGVRVKRKLDYRYKDEVTSSATSYSLCCHNCYSVRYLGSSWLPYTSLTQWRIPEATGPFIEPRKRCSEAERVYVANIMNPDDK